MTSLAIPGSVESLGRDPFYGCSNLDEIEVVGESQSLVVVDDVLFDKEMTRLIWCSPEKSGSYEIPSTVQTIDYCAFVKRRKLTSITIPDSVTEFLNGIFDECKELERVTIHSSYLSLKDYGFNYCSALKSVVFPRSILFIEEGAFVGCTSLETIYLPKGLDYPPDAFPNGVTIHTY